MSTKLAYTDLDLNTQALAVLQALSIIDAPDPSLLSSTAAWYNGRERGIVLTYMRSYADYKKAFHLVIAEQRNSDNLVVQSWIGPSRINPPTLADMPESAYAAQRCFPYLRVDLVVEFIQAEVTAYAGK